MDIKATLDKADGLWVATITDGEWSQIIPGIADLKAAEKAMRAAMRARFAASAAVPYGYRLVAARVA